MQKYIISVDAGGSSTKIAVIDENKKILKTFTSGCGSPAVLNDEKKAFANIDDGINQAIQEFSYPASIAMGVSGVEVVRDKEHYINFFQDKYHTKVLIENDAVIAVYSIVTDLYSEGILVLSGTGSAVMGIKDTKTRLIGGWGQLLTEVGSAYTTVRDFFISLILNYEAGNEMIPLGKKFMQKVGIKRVEDLKFLVYQRTKKDVAGYASFITEEAHNGDLDAIMLLKKGANDLARDVKNAIKALNLTSNAVLGFRGGFIKHAPILQEELIYRLHQDEINLKVVQGDENPVYGGYYLAKRKGYLC